jgi:putative ABC transport system substrate-binding protein
MRAAAWHPRLSRRRFVQATALASVAGLAGCMGAFGHAPPPPQVYRLGYLDFTSGDLPSFAAFRGALDDLGYAEGQNLVIEYRSAAGRPERLPDLAAELVHLNVDVILATAAGPALAAAQATSTIPIVSPNMGDPVAVGLADSLARPGRNVTGLSSMTTNLGAKRVELLKEAAPGLSRVVVLAGSSGPASAALIRQTEEAARALGLEARGLTIPDPNDIESQFDPMAAWGADAIVVVPNAWSPSRQKCASESAVKE